MPPGHEEARRWRNPALKPTSAARHQPNENPPATPRPIRIRVRLRTRPAKDASPPATRRPNRPRAQPPTPPAKGANLAATHAAEHAKKDRNEYRHTACGVDHGGGLLGVHRLHFPVPDTGRTCQSSRIVSNRSPYTRLRQCLLQYPVHVTNGLGGKATLAVAAATDRSPAVHF